MKSGRDIAMSVDPNTSDDVCTFCKHAEGDPMTDLRCTKGHQFYFRSISNMGPIYVSDCGEGELRPELAAIDTRRRE